MPRSPVPVVCALLAAGLGPGLVGCGGGTSTNGVELKAPAMIVAASKQAADAASSVHVAGSIAAAGAPTTFDLSLVRDKGASGTLSVNGRSFDLIRIGSSIYVKGSPAFYRTLSGAAAQVLQGKWLKGQSTSGSFAAIGPFTDLTSFVDKALTQQPNMKLTKGSKATVAGQKAIQIKDNSGGTLSVATTGKPYPVQIATGGRTGGTVTFNRWNGAVPLSAPASSVDINQLQAGK